MIKDHGLKFKELVRQSPYAKKIKNRSEYNYYFISSCTQQSLITS